MNSALERSIRSHIPEAAGFGSFDFVKFSTPGSARGLYPKILFLAFVRGEARPRYVVKSVRSSALSRIIEDGFKALSGLNEMVAGSTLSGLFPRALFIDSYDGIAFSVETAVNGRHAYSSDADIIVQAYEDFQQLIIANKKKVSAREYSKSILSSLDIGQEEKAKLIEHSNKLFNEQATVALLPQHGDMTLDNLFIEEDKVHMVDCDNASKIALAGFDLYHLLNRIEDGMLSNKSHERFEKYFKLIGEPSFDQDYVWLYFLLGHQAKNWDHIPGNAADVIAAFEKSLNGWDNGASA